MTREDYMREEGRTDDNRLERVGVLVATYVSPCCTSSVQEYVCIDGEHYVTGCIAGYGWSAPRLGRVADIEDAGHRYDHTRSASIRAKLMHAVTAYDRRREGRAGWNRFALPQYIERVGEICNDIDAGADVREAIIAGLSGSLATACLKAVGEGALTRDEAFGGSWVYRPIKAQS